MKRILLTLMAVASLTLANAHARIGWTYEQCVAHWGKQVDRIILQKEEEDKLTFVPLYIFRYGHRYMFVEFSHYSFDNIDDKLHVIKEEITDKSGF